MHVWNAGIRVFALFLTSLPYLFDWWVTMLPEGLSGGLYFSFHTHMFKSLRNKDEEHIQVFGKTVQRLFWHTLGSSPVFPTGTTDTCRLLSSHLPNHFHSQAQTSGTVKSEICNFRSDQYTKSETICSEIVQQNIIYLSCVYGPWRQ